MASAARKMWTRSGIVSLDVAVRIAVLQWRLNTNVGTGRHRMSDKVLYTIQCKSEKTGKRSVSAHCWLPRQRELLPLLSRRKSI